MSFATFFDYIFGDRTRLSHSRSASSGIYTAVCERCLHPFDYKLRRSGLQRDSVEYEPLRKRLMLSPAAPNPVFCDACFMDTMSPEQPAPMTTGMPGTTMPLVMRCHFG